MRKEKMFKKEIIIIKTKLKNLVVFRPIKLVSISIISMLLISSIVIARPTPNTENQYYVFGDYTDAVPQICYNWTDNETYLYPFNESIFYRNETGTAYDLGLTSDAIGDGYAGDMGHPHDQDLNITSNPFFNLLTAISFFGDGGNLTNITASGDGYAGIMGHPHDQDLNESSTVIFENITYNDDQDFFRINALDNDIYLDTDLAKPSLQIHSTGETSKYYESSARARLSFNQNVPPMIWTKLLLMTVDYDLNNDYHPILVAFLVPLPGLYHISYSVYVESMGDRTDVGAMIYKNGNPAGGYELVSTSTLVLKNIALSGSDILQLTTNDYIELYVYHTHIPSNKAFVALVYSNYLSICKIA